MEAILNKNTIVEKKQENEDQNKPKLFNFRYIGIYGYVFLVAAFIVINVIQFIFIYDKVKYEDMILNFKL